MSLLMCMHMNICIYIYTYMNAVQRLVVWSHLCYQTWIQVEESYHAWMHGHGIALRTCKIYFDMLRNPNSPTQLCLTWVKEANLEKLAGEATMVIEDYVMFLSRSNMK